MFYNIKIVLKYFQCNTMIYYKSCIKFYYAVEKCNNNYVDKIKLRIFLFACVKLFLRNIYICIYIIRNALYIIIKIFKKFFLNQF